MKINTERPIIKNAIVSNTSAIAELNFYTILNDFSSKFYKEYLDKVIPQKRIETIPE